MAKEKRKNKPRNEPVGATISGHAPHDIVDRVKSLVGRSGETRSAIVVEALRAGLPAVERRYAKKVPATA